MKRIGLIKRRLTVNIGSEIGQIFLQTFFYSSVLLRTSSKKSDGVGRQRLRHAEFAFSIYYYNKAAI